MHLGVEHRLLWRVYYCFPAIVEHRSCSSTHTRVPYCLLKSQIRISSKRKTMKNCCRFWALLWFLFATIQKGQSEIKCELKSGVNSALNKVGSAALRGIYYHGNRNSQNMHLMDCYCIDEDVSRCISYFQKSFLSGFFKYFLANC